MPTRKWNLHPALICLLLLVAHISQANEKHSVRFRWENDTFQRQLFGIGEYEDRHYTQGAWLDYVHSDNESPTRQAGNFLFSRSLMNGLPGLGMNQVHRTRGGLTLGQEMYTPEFIAFGPSGSFPGQSPTAFELQADDRPYAGYLHLGPSYERRGPAPFPFLGHLPAKDRLSIDFGIVGPESQADDTQTIWHEVFNGVEPVGWRHQLKNEPALLIQGGRSWIWTTQAGSDSFGVDLVPDVGFDLGNVSIRATVGLDCRVGFGLPRDFVLPGRHRSEPSTRPLSLFLFGGVEGSAVARDIFLDGNTFKESHSVEKETFVGQVSFGVGAYLFKQSLEGRVAWTGKTREFEKQRDADSYITFTLAAHF